ncbi:ABC transporter substrate-binding protein [Nitratireductor soli]|uniref:ABC transporter substrate-binding protein n=1 Tax=Nitratireductor soli TaxID=1670619 RepID=UPI001FCDC5D2|nr:ABC transporter substrate-binding protein [Nitratireductor soli]
MLAALGSAGERDRRDGAKLAAMQLGGDQVTLAVYNARPGAAGAGIEALIGRGAKILIGPSRTDQLGAFSAGAAEARPPVVAFLPNGVARPPGIFAFLSDETDSAVEVASYAVQAGRKRIVLLHPPEMEQAGLARLRKGIEAKGGQVSAALPFSARASDGVASQGAVLKAADAVLLGPGLESPAAAVAALRATGALSSGALILGTSELPAQRGLMGTLVCRVDQAAVADVTQRYRAEFGRAMTKDAAYGFDAAALAIGIIRSRGADALTAATLSARGGFRGLLGAFRFTAPGDIERNCSIYRVEGDSYQMQDPAPNGF